MVVKNLAARVGERLRNRLPVRLERRVLIRAFSWVPCGVQSQTTTARSGLGQSFRGHDIDMAFPAKFLYIAKPQIKKKWIDDENRTIHSRDEHRDENRGG